MIGRSAPDASPSPMNCLSAASLSSSATAVGRTNPRIVKSFHKTFASGSGVTSGLNRPYAISKPPIAVALGKFFEGWSTHCVEHHFGALAAGQPSHFGNEVLFLRSDYMRGSRFE